MFDNAYKVFAGIHRVQRVSATEKSDRRHTSTITVSILAEKETSNNVLLNDSDIRVDTFRASGPGGQHRNKTDSGVRMTHIPTGVVVTATEDRSQHKNRYVARQRLIEALQNQYDDNVHEEMNEQRQIDYSEVAFVWTGWRDQVKSSSGKKTSMKKALSGKLSPLMK